MEPSLPTPPLMLASQSPRRRRLLSWLGVAFDSISVDTPESLDTPLARTPDLLAESLAVEKLEAALERPDTAHRTVLCFDTIVVLDGVVLGKPSDENHAREMLRALSGRTHQVVTGVAVSRAPGAREVFSVTTDVTMDVLDDTSIDAWLGRGEALGCAGAYNIEGQIARVGSDECFQNVAGLPLCHLYVVLRDTGAPEGLVAPSTRCDAALGRTCTLGPRLLSRA